jgi:hypothetical protein
MLSDIAITIFMLLLSAEVINPVSKRQPNHYDAGAPKSNVKSNKTPTAVRPAGRSFGYLKNLCYPFGAQGTPYSVNIFCYILNLTAVMQRMETCNN